MATIDLIVLGILKKEPMSAYDMQKLVEYRNISKWVKVSTPSIYKKVIQLEKKGLIQGKTVKEGNMAEKTVYSLTKDGEDAFEALMLAISDEPIHLFLDCNAVIVNLLSLPPNAQKACFNRIEQHVLALRQQLEHNINEKNDLQDVPEMGKMVLQQQYLLIQAMETWLQSLKKTLSI